MIPDEQGMTFFSLHPLCKWYIKKVHQKAAIPAKQETGT